TRAPSDVHHFLMVSSRPRWLAAVRWFRRHHEEPMFSHLPESRSVPPRRRLAIAVSAVVHAAIIWEAMHGTAAARSAPRRIAETIPFYVATRHPERTVHFVSAPDRGHPAPQFAIPPIGPVTIPLPTAPSTPMLPDSWPAHPSGAD